VWPCPLPLVGEGKKPPAGSRRRLARVCSSFPPHTKPHKHVNKLNPRPTLPPPQEPLSTMPPPRPAPAPASPPRAAQKGALEKLVELLTLFSLGLLLLGALYLKIYGFASPRSSISSISSSSSSRHILSSFVGGAGGGRQGEDELREIMSLAKQAQMRGEIAQYGGLEGWLEQYMKRKKAILAGAIPVVVVETSAQPEASSTPPCVQERAKASAGSYFFTALMASILAAAVLHHYNHALTPQQGPA